MVTLIRTSHTQGLNIKQIPEYINETLQNWNKSEKLKLKYLWHELKSEWMKPSGVNKVQTPTHLYNHLTRLQLSRLKLYTEQTTGFNLVCFETGITHQGEVQHVGCFNCEHRGRRWPVSSLPALYTCLSKCSCLHEPHLHHQHHTQTPGKHPRHQVNTWDTKLKPETQS